MKARIKPLALDPGDTFQAAVKVKNLSPRISKKTLRFQKSLNASLAAGTYYLIAVVDSKEKNNDPVVDNMNNPLE